MIEVEMSKDIRDFEPKVIGSLTARQMKYIAIAACYGVPILLLPLPVTFMVKAVIAGILMLPCIACGSTKVCGLPLDEFMAKFVETEILSSRFRIYKCADPLGNDPETKKDPTPSKKKKKHTNLNKLPSKYKAYVQ